MTLLSLAALAQHFHRIFYILTMTLQKQHLPEGCPEGFRDPPEDVQGVAASADYGGGERAFAGSISGEIDFDSNESFVTRDKL